MTYQPLGISLLVRVLDPQAATASGVLLPGNASSVRRATVEAVGAGRLLPNGERVPLLPKVGDTVLLKHRAGDPLNDPSLLVVDEDDLLAVEVPEVAGVVFPRPLLPAGDPVWPDTDAR